MNTIHLLLLVWSAFVGFGTIYGLLRLRKTEWDVGVTISGGVSLLYAIFTALSIKGFLMPPVPSWWAWTVAPVGLIVFVIAQALAFWSAKELNKNFSARLGPVDGAGLVTSGPYQICRHPIMLSYLMSWIGTAIALGSIPMFVVFGLISILIMRRVALEEELLESIFGKEFQIYKRKVSAITPFLSPKSKEGRQLDKIIDLLKSPDWKNLFRMKVKKHSTVL